MWLKKRRRRKKQCLYNFRWLQWFSMSHKILKSSTTPPLRFILTSTITWWFGNHTTFRTQNVEEMPRAVIRGELPSRQSMKTAWRVVKDPSHQNLLFTLLPTGRWYCSIGTHAKEIKRLRDRFFFLDLFIFYCYYDEYLLTYCTWSNRACRLHYSTALCTLHTHWLVYTVYCYTVFYCYSYMFIWFAVFKCWSSEFHSSLI